MAEPKVRLRKPGWKLPLKICPVCFGEFKRKKRGNDAGLCCSRECGFTLLRWTRAKSRAFHEARDELRRWGGRARNEQRRSIRKAHALILGSIIRFVVHPLRPCAECGAAMGRSDGYGKRCHPCSVSAKRERLRTCPIRRADKARRKALHRGKVEGAERFDPLEILARDGWRCHICGISTPKRLRGTYHPQAPELDHIMPLALGGQHTRQNTACACRKCNIIDFWAFPVMVAIATLGVGSAFHPSSELSRFAIIPKNRAATVSAALMPKLNPGSVSWCL